jgi:hypothetical protein
MKMSLRSDLIALAFEMPELRRDIVPLLRAHAARTAKTFSTERALEKYFQKHPNADKTKHKVAPKKNHPGAPDESGEKRPKGPEEIPGAKRPKGPEEIPGAKKPKQEEPEGKKPGPEQEEPEGAPGEEESEEHHFPLHGDSEMPPEQHGEHAPSGHGEHGEHGGHGEHDEHGEDEHKMTFKELWHSLSSGARSFVQKLPHHAQKFVKDEKFRTTQVVNARQTLMSAPGKYLRNAYDATKNEVKEFKEAYEGAKGWLSGRKMNHHERKAFRAVVIHTGIALTAGVLGAGLGAGAAALAGGVTEAFIAGTAKKIMFKAVAKNLDHFLEKIPMAHEIYEIGHHGVELAMEIADKLASDQPPPAPEEEAPPEEEEEVPDMDDEELDTEEPESEEPPPEEEGADQQPTGDDGSEGNPTEHSPDEAIQMFTLAMVSKALQNFDTETLKEALEEVASGGGNDPEMQEVEQVEQEDAEGAENPEGEENPDGAGEGNPDEMGEENPEEGSPEENPEEGSPEEGNPEENPEEEGGFDFGEDDEGDEEEDDEDDEEDEEGIPEDDEMDDEDD